MIRSGFSCSPLRTARRRTLWQPGLKSIAIYRERDVIEYLWRQGERLRAC